jgi:hypothetical protein
MDAHRRVEALAMCVDLKNCEWALSTTPRRFPNSGKPMCANSKIDVLYALRTFFRDLQHWEIIPRSFDPHIAFRVPRPLRALIGFDPRVLPDDVWAKLIWAGLNITAADLSAQGSPGSWRISLLSSVVGAGVVRGVALRRTTLGRNP